MMHLRIGLLVYMGWCMVWPLPAQASWEAYQQAGEAAFNRGDYETAQRMFLAAVREAKDFGPQDPRLDISLSKLELLRVTRGAHSQADVRTQRATGKKSYTRKAGSVHRGHRRQPAHPEVQHARAGRQHHALRSAHSGERRQGTQPTVARSAHRASPSRHLTSPVHHGERREALETPRHRRETPGRQRGHTLQQSHTTHHHTTKTTGKPNPVRSRHR